MAIAKVKKTFKKITVVKCNNKSYNLKWELHKASSSLQFGLLKLCKTIKKNYRGNNTICKTLEQNI